MFAAYVLVFSLHFISHRRGWPPMSLCKQSPRASGHLFPHLSAPVGHATAAAALTNQNTTTTKRKSQRLATAAEAAAAGLSLKTTITTAATYRDTRSRPRTSSHMSGVNPIRMMVVVALLSLLSSSPFLSPRSHQSLLPPLRLLTWASVIPTVHTHRHIHTHIHTAREQREREEGVSEWGREGGSEWVTAREEKRKERKRGRKG